MYVTVWGVVSFFLQTKKQVQLQLYMVGEEGESEIFLYVQ